ncbi:MAG: ATP-binding protein [Candidatus Omnitrophica bacterium]|nr:ATP-binding protein [Candidatus Omnitrophota bacterium]
MEREIQNENTGLSVPVDQTTKKERSIYENDQQYLDEYAKIYSLLMERYSLLETMQERRLGNLGKPHKDLNGKEYAKKNFQELTKIIEVEEWLFWEKVDRSKQAGHSFVVEEAAHYYQLSHFEKRVILLLLCVEVFGEIRLPLTSSNILNILSLNNSFSERMRNMLYFDKKKPLLHHQLICASHSYSPVGYRITSSFLDFLIKRINDEATTWPRVSSEPKPCEVEHVGYIKTPEYSIDKVIISEEIKEKTLFFLQVYKEKKFQELEVDKTIRNSRGLTFLFYGPPGTGKSMLAEAIAFVMEKKMLVVEIPKIMNMFLGETDKNISAMFKYAKDKDLVLLIDEADSFLYSRDIASSDFKVRFVNVMLTELERFEGVAIFTTNMDEILDPALERRIVLKVQFELPNWERRVEIWKRHIPPSLKLREDVDFTILAKKYEFSGGNIKNAVLNSIRRVLFRKETVLTMDDMIFGAELEMQGMFNQKNNRVIRGFTK